MNPFAIFSLVTNGITDYFKGKQEIKKASQSAEAKLKQKTLDKEANIELTDAEWESISLKTQQNSWKDEYVTLIITAPIPLIFIGSILTAFSLGSGTAILTGTLEGIKSLKDLGMDYGFLMNAVVMAAIGLKVWRA